MGPLGYPSPGPFLLVTSRPPLAPISRVLFWVFDCFCIYWNPKQTKYCLCRWHIFNISITTNRKMGHMPGGDNIFSCFSYKFRTHHLFPSARNTNSHVFPHWHSVDQYSPPSDNLIFSWHSGHSVSYRPPALQTPTCLALVGASVTGFGGFLGILQHFFSQTPSLGLLCPP